jgi:hypothetical protein
MTTMKTSNETRTAEEQTQKRFLTGQLCFTQQTQPSNSKPKSRKARKWLKFIEFAVVGFATWLNPNAGFLIFLLKLCFQILELLQENREQ